MTSFTAETTIAQIMTQLNSRLQEVVWNVIKSNSDFDFTVGKTQTNHLTRSLHEILGVKCDEIVKEINNALSEARSPQSSLR